MDETQPSETSKALLAIILWEAKRGRAVTVAEVVQRMGWGEDRTMDAFAELMAKGLVDVVATGR